MLTIVTPATSRALTTLERARSVLGFGTADNAAMEVRIAQASRVVADYCRRPFGIETVRQREDCPQPEGITFARAPVRAIASVSLGGQDIDPSAYAIDAATGKLLKLDDAGGASCWWGLTSILYTAGYVLPVDGMPDPPVDLPEPVERATIELAGTYLAAGGRDPRLKSEDVDGLGKWTWYVPGSGDAILLPEIEQLLAPYRRFWP